MQKLFLTNGKLNMEYKIKFTEKFLEDIEDICKYY